MVDQIIKNFTPPGIPLLFIKFYRYLKKFIKLRK